MKLPFLSAFIAALACGVLLGTVASGLPVPTLHSHACSEGRSRVPSECGTFVVYENRSAGSGRTIALGFILLKARHRSNRAIYFNPGGPGASATQFAGDIADGNVERSLSVLRDRYDILLLDNRGMGESHPLDCSIYSSENPAPYFLHIWPSAALQTCRRKDARTSDLSQYTTDNATDDLDALRAALGYRKIVLATGSYGTYTSLVYMRRHPASVESAVLDGVAPPHLLILPLEDAYGAQLAMNDVIVECGHDSECNRRFPFLGPHFASLVRRFADGLIAISIRNAATHRMQRVRLSREVFADRLRQALYTEDGAKFVPYIVDQAYRGDYVPLGAMINFVTLGLAQEVDTGANLSYACAEQLPFITPAEIVRTSANSFQGDSRVRAEQAACRIWNVRAVPSSEDRVVRSSLPVLMISGTNDPTSPAIYARQELRYLPNARIVLQRGAGHGETTACTERLIVDFVRARAAKRLKSAECAGSFRRPPFATSLPTYML